MIIKGPLFWCPLRYALSKVIHRKEWNKRKSAFKTRIHWNIDNWLEFAKTHNSNWEKNICKFILSRIEENLWIAWSTVRPDDLFERELHLPEEKIHRKMYTEMMEDIGVFLEMYLDVKTGPAIQTNRKIETVKDLIDYSQWMWSTYPHIDEPNWEEWMKS